METCIFNKEGQQKRTLFFKFYTRKIIKLPNEMELDQAPHDWLRFQREISAASYEVQFTTMGMTTPFVAIFLQSRARPY
ncbi:hypothetical protein Peur_042477 [Populus x canadensis]